MRQWGAAKQAHGIRMEDLWDGAGAGAGSGPGPGAADGLQLQILWLEECGAMSQL